MTTIFYHICPKKGIAICEHFALAKRDGLEYNLPICRCGGIGRRPGLKIPCPQGRAGSTPATGTTWSQSLLCDHVFLCPWQKRRHPPAPLLLLCKLNPLYWASIFQTDIIRTRFFAGDGFGLFVYLGKCKRSASKTALPFISMSIRNQEHTGQERDRNQKIKARRKANMGGKGLAVLLRGRSHSCPPAPKPFFHCARGQRVCQNVIDWLAIIYRILQTDGIIKS